MTKKLFFEAIIKYILGVIIVGFLVFLPAGRVYARGIIFMALLFLPMLLAGIFMMIKSPSLLARRLDMREKRETQGRLIGASAVMFLFGFVLSSFCHRFELLILPFWVTVMSGIVLLLSYIMFARVLYENRYLSRTIKVEKGQRLIDTGLYSVIRHPMYLATVFLFISMPLVLGSLLGFLVFLAYPFIIASRILDEEELLSRELTGYDEYKSRVKYRLFPYIW